MSIVLSVCMLGIEGGKKDIRAQKREFELFSKRLFFFFSGCGNSSRTLPNKALDEFKDLKPAVLL